MMKERALEDHEQDLIQKFLTGVLTAEEQEDFDRYMQDREVFAEAVAEALLVDRAYEAVKREKFRKRLRTGKEGTNGGGQRRWWLWGVGLLLLALLGWWLWTHVLVPEAPPDSTQPAPVAANYELDPIIEAQRANLALMGGGWEDDLLQHRYREAMPKLEAELAGVENLADRAGAAYFLGLLHLYTDTEDSDVDRSIQLLQGAKNYQDAAAHLLIAYRKAGRLEEARSFFQANPDLTAALPDSLRVLL